MKIACFIAYGYFENKKNVDDIITHLLNHKLNIETHIYVGWNNKGDVFTKGKHNIKNIVDGYNYNGTVNNPHIVSIIKVKNEPHKRSQKAYYTWNNLINKVDIKYDKYLFFKDTYDEHINLKDILYNEYDLLVYNYYFINSKGPQQRVWHALKKKNRGYFNSNDSLICSITKLIGFNSESFSKIKDSDFFNKGIRKKQFPIIKFFMPEGKVYSLTHSDYINI